MPESIDSDRSDKLYFRTPLVVKFLSGWVKIGRRTAENAVLENSGVVDCEDGGRDLRDLWKSRTHIL